MKDDELKNQNPNEQGYSDESEQTDISNSGFILDSEQLEKDNDNKIKLSRKEKRAERKTIRQEKKDQKSQKKKNSNSRWFWFFLLLLLAIIVLFMWDNHRKTAFIKNTIKTTDSIRYNEHFYKTKYQEKDSALNLLLSNYNNLLQDNIENSDELYTNKKELLKLQKVVYLQDSILRQVKSTFDVAMGSYGTDQVSVNMKDGKLYITMRSKLLFPSGSSEVQYSGMKVLKSMAKVLKANSNINVVVEGHTDNIPMNANSKLFKDNWDLSTARAVNVTRLLTNKYNIKPERLTSAGRSMFYPIAPNTTVEGRAKNRRIEFILTPNLEDLYKLTDAQGNAQ